MRRHDFAYGRRMLITGGSSGIGMCCARLFADMGYEVFAVSRSAKEGAQRVGQGCIRSLPIDVTNERGVRELAREIGPVGIVIHCAGMGIAGAAEDTPLTGARAQMETNYFGVLCVNQAILPGMRALGKGLVLIVGSVAGRIGIPFQSHYASSKAALERYAEALRAEIAHYGVRVCVLEPGDTKTGFTKARALHFPEGSPYLRPGMRSVERMAQDEQNGKPCESVARAALRMINRRRPPVRRAVGADYGALLFAKRFLPDSLTAWIVGKMYAK